MVNFLASFHTHTSLSIHVDHNVQVEKQNTYNLQYQIGCARYIYIYVGAVRLMTNPHTNIAIDCRAHRGDDGWIRHFNEKLWSHHN